jgi:GTPase SAR1 family protein
MTETTDATFKIGLLGPSRVGKTSLVTALLAQTHDLLGESGVTINWADRGTESKLVQNKQDLEGDLLAGSFSPASLGSTMEPFTFRLKLDPGVPGSEIGIELLDFPGGWLAEKTRPASAAADWIASRQFITQSTALLIPVDAALLMEASLGVHWRGVSSMLTIAAVESVARDWATERKRREPEPALLVFCPVKCESYFTDNGGIKNRSAELERRFHDTYGAVIRAVRQAAPLATLLYAPVDTLGCVELVDAEWPEPEAGQVSFSATYRIREPKIVSRVGVDDVMRAICKQLVEGRRLLDVRQSEILDEQAAIARGHAELDEGFFRNLWLIISRERKAREEAARIATEEARDNARRVAALDSVLKQIAAGKFGPRVKTL